MAHVRESASTWESNTSSSSSSGGADGIRRAPADRGSLSESEPIATRADMPNQEKRDSSTDLRWSGGSAKGRGESGVGGTDGSSDNRNQDTLNSSKRQARQQDGAYRGSSSPSRATQAINIQAPPPYVQDEASMSDFPSHQSRGGTDGDSGEIEEEEFGATGSYANFLPKQDDVLYSGSECDDGSTSVDSTPRIGADGETQGFRKSSVSLSPTDEKSARNGRERGERSHERNGSDNSGRDERGGDERGGGYRVAGSGDMARKGSSGLKNEKRTRSSTRPGVPSKGGSTNLANSKTVSNDPVTRSIPGVSARPAGVPFGASALSKTMPHDKGRPRSRGLRPRNSGGSGGAINRVPSFSSSSGRQPSFQVAEGGGAMGENEAEFLAAQAVAPGIPVEVVVRAAVKIESVMRVLIARGYVRRKLVSEVTAFSLIMERGIEVIKHAFTGKAKPKNVTVNFVSRKGAMQLSWGGKSGVPLETIFGVTKGIKTDALQRAVDPERAENCFSLLAPDRTIDFEVDNPWLVLLVVRALRLFLGAHYDTLPAPTFFSHLCVRPCGTDRTEKLRTSLVWTGEEKAPGQEPASTPTERTSGDSTSDDSGEMSSSGRSPWDGSREQGHEEAAAEEDGAFDSDSRSVATEIAGNGSEYPLPPPPSGNAPEVSSTGSADDAAAITKGVGSIRVDEEEGSNRSPGGIMALFSSGRRPSEMGFGGSGESEEATPTAAAEPPAEEEPLTASALLATRGMSKRLTLSKKMSAANNVGGPLKGRRFDLMELPKNQASQGERREKGSSDTGDAPTGRNQGMSISIGAGYELPEEQERTPDGRNDPERIAVVDDLNDKLQSLRKLCVPQTRLGTYRPGRTTKTMAGKHMAFFKGAGGGAIAGSGLGSVADMWGDGVRRQYHTDMVRSQHQSVEDVRTRDAVRTTMLVSRSSVHRVTRKAPAPSETR